jgi:alkylated DNA repair dioxygenase AlkB
LVTLSTTLLVRLIVLQYSGGDGTTVSLEAAPPCVREALAYIKKRAALVLEGKEPNLNEVLSAAYLNEQKMTFHSDAEKGLGPIVSALSLGSSATMQFRPIPCKNKSEVKNKRRAVLTLELRHASDSTKRSGVQLIGFFQGDVVVMESLNVQKYYQ